MSQARAPVGKIQARQLSRVLGILETVELGGNEAIVVADVLEQCRHYAESMPYQAEPHDFASIEAPEWQSLASFCEQAAANGLACDRGRARQLEDIAEERLREARA